MSRLLKVRSRRPCRPLVPHGITASLCCPGYALPQLDRHNLFVLVDQVGVDLADVFVRQLL